MQQVQQQKNTLAALQQRLRHAQQQPLQQQQQRLRHLQTRLQSRSPALAMQRQQERLHAVYQRLLPSIRRSLQQHQQQLGHLSQRLQSSSPLNTLARGYSVNFSAGKHLRSVQDIKVGDAFTSRLQDGEIAAVVTAISPQEN